MLGARAGIYINSLNTIQVAAIPTDCIMWDCKDISKILNTSGTSITNGQNVGKWIQRTNNGTSDVNTDWLSNAEVSPTYNATLNGISFPGRKNMWIKGTSTLKQFNRTLYIVITCTGNIGYFLSKGNYNTIPGYGWYIQTNFVRAWTRNTSTNNIITHSENVALNTKYLFTLVFNSQSGGQLRTYTNGTLNNTLSWVGASISDAQDIFDHVLGYGSFADGNAVTTNAGMDSGPDGPSWSFKGLVHELRIYPAIHTNSEVISRSTLMKLKWGIA